MDALSTGRFGHRFVNGRFLSIIAPASLESDERRRVAQDIINGVKASDVPSIDEALWKKWEDVKITATDSGMDEEKGFRHFLDNEYFQIISEVQQRQALSGEFVPELVQDFDDANEDVVSQRKQVLREAKIGDEDLVNKK